jgi:predicted nuclease of restriction endonuclease-like RecB superfamily
MQVLTADLARSRTHKDTITPLFIDTDDQRYRDTADELIQIFEEHLGEQKGELEDTIDQLTIADTDYKIVQGLAKLLKDECEFEIVAPVEPREIRQALFEKVNDSYPIVRQPTLGEDTKKLEVYSSIADKLGITLEECYRGMYADLEENKRLVRFGHRVSDEYEDGDESTTTTRLTGDSEESYAEDSITVDWLLTRYNLALAQAVLYDATEMRVRVWDSFSTVFSYVKLFGLMHRIYPIDSNGNRVASTDVADGYEATLDGAASLFSKSQKYGIRMANFLPALPLCDRWEMEADILDDDSGSTSRTLSFELDHTDDLSSHYSAQGDFDSDVERTLAQKWERANTDWELVREDDVLDLGAEVMLPDFAIEHPDGRRAVFEIVGFWTPEYLDEKLGKIRDADRENLIVAVSDRLDCSSEDFDGMDDRVLWFKSGIHVYDVVELAEEYAVKISSASNSA